MHKPHFRILVCDGPSCGVTHDSDALADGVRRCIAQNPDLAERVAVNRYTCFGRCDDGPNVFVLAVREGEKAFDSEAEPDISELEAQRGFYPGMTAEKLETIVQTHCGEGRVVDAWVDSY